MSRCKKVVIAFVMASVAATNAIATDTVEDRKAVMDAQIELLKKQADLNTALRAVAGTLALGLPTVVSVTQIGNQRTVRLQLPNGQISHFREGDAIRHGMVLTAIAPKQVVVAVANGKKMTAVPLEFAMVVQAGAHAQPIAPAIMPDALLPLPPRVVVPAIEAIPAAKPFPTPFPAQTAAAQGKGK
jgi:hypothetical protein